MIQDAKEKKVQILIVQGNPKIAETLWQTLRHTPNPSNQVHAAETLDETLTLISTEPLDIILYTLGPDIKDLFPLENICKKADTLPVIAFGANEDLDYACKAIETGAQDYISEVSINDRAVTRTIALAIERNNRLQIIRRRESKFRTIIDNLTDAYYEVDLRGNYTYVNKVIAERMGYSVDEMIGLNNRKFTSPEMAKKTLAFYSEVYKTGKPGTLDDYELTNRDGSKMILELSVSLLRDEDGNPIGFHGISKNVTDKKMALKALKQSEEKYRNILANIEDGYFEVNLKGQLTFYNSSMGKMFGFDKKQLLMLDSRKYMDEKNSKKVYKAYNKIYKTGKPNRSLQYEVIRIDGVKRHMESSVSLVKDQDDQIIGFRGIARDITARKQAALELARAKERAEAADRSKSNFLANMSHEIRTPMNGVIGMYNLLLGTELTNEQRDFVQTGKQSADSLLTVINDILDFSKIEAGKLDIETIGFDLRKTMMDMVALPALLAQNKKLEYIYQIDPKIPSFLMGDPGRLRQIIMNLSTNAIKFTPKGEVVFRVLLEKQTRQDVTLRFSVQDTGIGISKTDQDRLFNSFAQVDASTTRKYGGTGLGLAISKQLAQLMGGSIGVQSQKGHGATFWFTAVLKKQHHPQATQKRSAKIIKGRRFLLIDDNQSNLDVIIGYIKSWEGVCDTARSGPSAVLKMTGAAQKKQPYDFIICNMFMPGMDGAELGKRVKTDPVLCDSHLIMLTSQGFRGDAKEMKDIGFAAYLTKPVGDVMLFDCITMILEEKPSMDDRREKDSIITRHTLSENKHTDAIVLLVEDNIINRKLATHLLKRSGFRCEEAVNGKEAIKSLEKKHFDIVLMDIQMPEMDGLEATEVIRNPDSDVLNHDIPIIAMTAHAMKGDRKMCLDAGMDDYITKPIQPDAFHEALEGQLKRTRA